MERTDHSLEGTGIDDIANPLHVALYPNPARDQLTILSDKALTATIYSITGQLISQPAPGKVLPVAHLAAGMYLLQLTDGKQTSRLKFVKQ